MSASHLKQRVNAWNERDLFVLVTLLVTYATMQLGWLMLLISPPVGIIILAFCIIPPLLTLIACAPRAGALAAVVLPILFGFAVILPPAIMQSRKQARTTEFTNNLKQIGLQMHKDRYLDSTYRARMGQEISIDSMLQQDEQFRSESFGLSDSWADVYGG